MKIAGIACVVALLSIVASGAQAQQNQIARSAKAVPQVQRSADEVDIRGLKIGMPLQDATKLIASLISKPDGCVTANIGPNNADLYVYGDQIITCKNAMDYFGETTDVFNVFFVDGKINYVIFGYFTSETKSKEDRPSVYIALCEKYKVSPTVEKREVLEGSEYKIRSSFLDKNDNMVTTEADLEEQIDVSSNSAINEESKATVAFSRPNFAEWQQDRVKKMKDLIEQQRQKENEKAKGQL